MIAAIGAIQKNNPFEDPEYKRIIMELRQLGINPTGEKTVDKARLESEKKKIEQKIIQKTQEEQQQSAPQIDEDRSKMEVQKLGAMNVAELNKLLHGLE